MTTRTIFDISADLQALDDLLSDIGGEVTDEETEKAIDSWLAELGAERDSKLEAYAYLIAENEARALALKQEATRLKARRDAVENKVARLKERLKVYLELNGIDKIKTDLFTFALQQSGGKPKVNLVAFYAENPVELPEGLRRVKFEADLESIREKLEAEEEWVSQYAELQKPGRHLRIR